MCPRIRRTRQNALRSSLKESVSASNGRSIRPFKSLAELEPSLAFIFQIGYAEFFRQYLFFLPAPLNLQGNRTTKMSSNDGIFANRIAPAIMRPPKK